jgi:uncharacterized tellurite resistance protein B-like protein
MDRHRPHRRGWLTGALPTICACLVLVLPQVLFARAGGGEGWGGGGGGSGGGGGGGGDLDGIIYLVIQLIRLCIYYPHIGLPVLVVVLVVVVYAYRAGHFAHEGRVIRQGHVAFDANREVEGVAKLQERDPAFDATHFFYRIGTGFLKVQDGWSAQDLSHVRPFISDGIHERFSLQFGEQKQVGYRNVMENVKVHAVRLAQVHSDYLFDEATVRIDASAADYRIALHDGRIIKGSRAPQPFTEYWSFLRRRGVQTKLDRPGLIEGNCPNCGSGIEMNQFANCKNCGALLRSGEYDWVLAEITQASEWTPGRRHDLPGLDSLRERDPEFNLQHLEDRVSVMFWRKTMADRIADVRPFRKVATEAFADAYAANFRSQAERSFFGECAVGAVTTHGFYRDDGGGDSSRGRDHALVEVRWSGTQYVIRPDRLIEITDHTLVTRSLFVLARAGEAVSDAGRAISSAHCTKCGAPEADTASNACDYCGQVLNDVTRDWVLTDIVSMASSEAERLLDRLHTPVVSPAASNGNGATHPSDAAMVGWMVRMLLSDGSTSSAEHDVLRQLAHRRRVTDQQLETMLHAASEGMLQSPEPATREEAVEWLRSMASVAMADGKVHRDEVLMLQRVGGRYGFTSHDFKLMLNRARNDLLAEAKSELREQRMRRRDGLTRAR